MGDINSGKNQEIIKYIQDILIVFNFIFFGFLLLLYCNVKCNRKKNSKINFKNIENKKIKDSKEELIEKINNNVEIPYS